MLTKKDQNNAFLIHISALAGYFFPLGGVLAPLILWQVKKEESNYLDEQGKAAVNFNLSFFLYSFLLGLTFIPFFISGFFNMFSHIDQMHDNFHFNFPGMFGLIGGISIIGILSLIRFTLIILAAIKANNGEQFKYPITIKFIK
jgi:uncharacterized Tic20 family protein